MAWIFPSSLENVTGSFYFLSPSLTFVHFDQKPETIVIIVDYYLLMETFNSVQFENMFFNVKSLWFFGLFLQCKKSPSVLFNFDPFFPLPSLMVFYEYHLTKYHISQSKNAFIILSFWGYTYT